ncbi:hypothetical protein BV133_1808 [Blastochloris viridis]|uniref:Uncharacterized protein n=1 Tax=Blastochloris viridis TaxID=1079 RepID=A0A182D3B7_BLAVI|nr:hypothetical protein BV133_1808 [Blastochloris viridis]
MHVHDSVPGSVLAKEAGPVEITPGRPERGGCPSVDIAPLTAVPAV